MTIKEKLREDYKKNNNAAKKYILLFRYGSYLLNNNKHKLLLKIIRIVNRIWYVDVHGTDINYKANIGAGIKLPHLNGIIIAADTIIGDNCTIFQQVTIGEGSDSSGRAKIGDNVLIGAGAKIIGKVHIGDNVKIRS